MPLHVCVVAVEDLIGIVVRDGLCERHREASPRLLTFGPRGDFSRLQVFRLESTVHSIIVLRVWFSLSILIIMCDSCDRMRNNAMKRPDVSL